MAEELTTEMHYEFLEDMGVSKRDYFIYGASGAIARGVPKAEALTRYGLTEAEYDANIDRVLHDDSW